MFLIRKLGKILGGNSTPFQLMLTCLLACALGFMPGFGQALGLVLALTLLIIGLNTNLALAAILGILTKMLSLFLVPASFAVGRVLLDGPTQGLFQALINAPVFAYFGFEHYTTTGGLALGLVLGFGVGLLLTKAIQAFRRRMAYLEGHSERYQRFTKKFWVQALSFIFFAARPGKVNFESLLSKRIGNPVRPLGLIFLVAVVALGFIAQLFAREPIVTMAAQNALERANGATVDLKSANLSLKENRLTLEELALADPSDLDTDLFRAEGLVADISGANLLRKRLQLDQVVVRGASHGKERATPGHLTRPAPQPTPQPKREEEAKSIEDYIEEARKWKERLAQLREWLEKISGPETKETEKGEPKEQRESLPERIRRQVREKGYHRVIAGHLVEGRPLFTLRELSAQKVAVAQLKGETVDITGKNLSTHPHLLDEAPEVQIESSQDRINFQTFLGQLAPARSENTLRLHYRGLPIDSIAQQLKLGAKTPLSGGTVDLETEGDWIREKGVLVNLPLWITLHQTKLVGIGETPVTVDQLRFPVMIQGPLDNPTVKVDHQQLSKALAKAGATAAAQRLKKEAADRIGKELPQGVSEELQKKGQGLFNRFLGGDSKEKEEQ